ncbi:MarR family winged helix-turn-helix transcriptional regulator [Streptococcus loxodontisalivarius]|uniref:DNA-binding MarR family transcriptional regulator n=1 Tax=Streptococcus loxodontisalivarius TaxID=1349415 RepID=A0ABS2PS62_9STRE|nr:MarR family transcriptional regulator [Streptococcus loxodontisalivarius]MBM7642883.1 DNA-binding MarR family transcriptional regulator [Streptococcus loxodontisalivarius]
MTETAISILIKRASLAFDKTANELLLDFELTNTQFKTLKYLYRHDQLSITQKKLEDYFDMSNPTVTGILQNLEKKDFIYRVANPNDARSKVIGLTDKSLAIKEKMLTLGSQMDDLLTERLQEDEKAQLTKLLSKMLGDKHAD